MKRYVLLILLLALGFQSALAAGLKVIESGFDAQGRFNVHVPFPAGSRHAALEIFSPGPPATWKVLVSGALDGRKGRVILQLPEHYSPKAIVRGTAGPETTVPAAQLNDPSLFTVIYDSPIGEQTKINFLRDASLKMSGWSSLPRPEAQAKLIAWAMENPLVADASVTTLGDNISIRFTDDDICVLMAKPRREITALDRAPSEARIEVRAADGTTPGFDKTTTGLSIPGSRQAIAAFSLESTFPDSTSTIAGWLRSQNYKADTYGSTSVLTVKSWSTAVTPIGVLFWQIHGCPYKKKDGSESTALVTREFASEALSQGAYATMRGTGQLGLAIADGETVPYYTITGTFVKSFMRFAPNSLVVVDACFGANPDLANAFLDAGAGSYVSWDWLSGPQSGKPCRQIFDRLLGMNAESPVSAVKERSFTVDVVSHWMHRKGYDEDPSTKFPDQTRPNAMLIWKHRQTNPAHMLKPSIMRILQEANSPGEPFSKYLIEGDFGDDPGDGKRTVLWGGTPLQILRWEGEEGIVIRIPKPVPLGNFQVIIDKNFASKSNQVPMTEWTIPFTFDRREQGSLNANMTFNVKMRADIHGERYEPEGEVKYLWKSYWNLADCSGKLKASGSYKPSLDETYTWSGGADLVSVDLGATEPPANIIHAGANFSGNGSTLSFSVSAAGLFTETYSWDGGSESYDQQAEIASHLFFQAPLPTITAPAYRFPGNSKTVREDTRTDTLSWTTTTPAFAPDADTPR